MAEFLDKKKIRNVFRNVQKHRLIEQLIRQFSTNKEDIRKKALARTDLSLCENVLDLGCAFGSFTEALEGRLHPAAKITGLDIVPEYRHFFLEACSRAGYAGTFSAAGINHIKKIPAASFDLVICSFALYFFADMIPEIARVLKSEGKFITITHSQSNMKQLDSIIKKILKKNGFLQNEEPLPVDIIIQQFSAENGQDLLSKSFDHVVSFDFKNNLVFPAREINFFIEYLNFKSPFFLIGTNAEMRTISAELISNMKKKATKDKIINICKDDKIFICSQSLPAKDLP